MSYISSENPLGILAIDHLEFTCASLATPTKDLFYTLGLVKTAFNEIENSELFTQGQVRFLLVSGKENSHPANYLKAHGEGVSTISFLVEDARHALNEARSRGALVLAELKIKTDSYGEYLTAKIQGFGDVHNEFVQRPNKNFRPGFTTIDNDPLARPLETRCSRIDHLTNNVPKGEMRKWVEFYQTIYGFKVTRYFDIKGLKTGLQSEVVQLPNGVVIIPINEPDVAQGKSQIQEFLDLHRGAGVQHIALSTPNIISTVGELRSRGIEFLEIPHTYYEDIPKRKFNVTEDLQVLETRQLLVDGDSEGYLIQNFTKTYVGPLFFEYIQRKNHNGFGEGNFQALFDSIERDQQNRGYL